MATTNLQIKQGLLVNYADTPPYDFISTAVPSSPFFVGPKDAAYFPGADIPSELRKKHIYRAVLWLYGRGAYITETGLAIESSASITVNSLKNAYNRDEIIGNKGQPAAYSSGTYLSSVYSWKSFSLPTDGLVNGVSLTNSNYATTVLPLQLELYSPGSAYQPYYEVEYEEAEPSVLYRFPSAGWVDPQKDLTLSWGVYIPSTIDALKSGPAVVEWQVDGGAIKSATVNDADSYKLPASSLPSAGTLKWRVTVSTEEGVSSAPSSWATLTTIDSVPVVTAKSPSGGYCDAAADTRFEWDYSVSTGAAPTAYELQYRTSGGTWEVLSSASSDATFALVDTTVLPAGPIEWRVRASNQSSVWSDWSDPVQVLLVSSPAAPSVTVISGSSPQPVIAWQSVGQVGYQIRVGEYDTGTIYGTAQNYKFPGFLPDGIAQVQVRIQNRFEFWSEWSSCGLDIKNNLGEVDALPLVVAAGGHAEALLSWSAVANALSYLVYRDSLLIARCSKDELQYLDSLGIGAVSYRVRAVLDGGNYVLSEPFVVTLHPKGVQIRALQGDEWLDVSRSLTSLPSVDVTRTRAVSLYNYAGARYPVPEVSPFETMTYNLAVAFKRGDPTVDRFEALMGQLVIVKDQYDNLVVGVLGTWTRAQNAFVVSYKATITQVDRSLYEVDSI